MTGRDRTGHYRVSIVTDSMAPRRPGVLVVPVVPVRPGELRLAVLVPCFNEEAAVPKVVADFRAALPGCTVFVYDNCSTDATATFIMNESPPVPR